MSVTAIFAGRVLTPLEEIIDGVVLVEDRRIAAVGHRDNVQIPAGTREIRAPSMTIVPGFVDVHIHGAGGHDVMEADPAALRTVAQTAARFGTTSLVATTVTAELNRTCRSVERISQFIRAQSTPSVAEAEILGIHFEGPFISSARRGVQPQEWIVASSTESLRRMLDASAGCGKILTLAPELPGALELVDAARAKGLVVALGHTDATFDESQAAIQRGARHAVHVFNAMRPFSHRETGILGAVLTSPDVTTELIADGVHVDPAAMRLLFAAKGAARVVLVSDATAAAAMPDGTYCLGTFEVSVAGGVCRNAEGRLAGSTLTLDRALRNVVALGVPLADALRMLALNPATLLGMELTKGVLAPGADADLVLLNSDLHVAGVMTRGTGLQ
ncbi:MAG: N-acetylglucosamine-6-phosphate deacetylase [Acidobacteria bacterium]|nr:N-acetylglucosamine-6-phosphate deacetylase [Acidobacteriota bacterium]MCL5287731.1 N-acetylglucosamine-6-phosphate deacetylase [Acidobacteriota bacterium]